MFRRLLILLTLTLALVSFQVGVASAHDIPLLNLPPGIAAQAESIHAAMMQDMHHAGMSHEEMKMMMADMQTLVDQLPPGIFLEILRLMQRLDKDEMMFLHQQIRQGELLNQPPGQILRFVKDLAQ